MFLFSAEKMDREADRAAIAVKDRADSLIKILNEIDGASPIDIPGKDAVSVECGECRPLVLTQDEIGSLHKGIMTLSNRVDYLMRIMRRQDERRTSHQNTL